jgi:hypothetical protein
MGGCSISRADESEITSAAEEVGMAAAVARTGWALMGARSPKR